MLHAGTNQQQQGFKASDLERRKRGKFLYFFWFKISSHIIIWKILEWLLILGYALCCQNMSTLIEFQYPPPFSRPSCLLLSIIAFVIFVYLYLYQIGICLWLLHPLYLMSQSSSTPSPGKTATPLSILATPCLGDTSYWWVQKYLGIFSMKIWEILIGLTIFGVFYWNLKHSIYLWDSLNKGCLSLSNMQFLKHC